MADLFKLNGSYSAEPQGSTTSFAITATATINESRVLGAKHTDTVVLDADAPVAVNFGGGVANANLVILKAVGGKVKAALTSADGAAQAVPFDTYLILFSETVPITAITLTRVAGTSTTVSVFLGQKA